MTAFEPLLGTTILAAVPALLPAYLIAAVVGGGFVLFSVVLGGDHDTAGADVGGDLDLDVDVDVDVDVDTDLHPDLHHGGLSQWFSMQFLVHFTAMFGAVGTVLSLMTDLSALIVALAAFGTGLIGGQAIHQSINALKKGSGNSATRLEDYVNQLARVTVGLNPGRRGEVALTVGGDERRLVALARHRDEAYAAGDEVVVVGFTEGTAEVVSRKEFEFVNDSDLKGETI